ncbi:hypothetical protein MC885_009181 [Smutsia gigantea]|nr:hypothetical protein MC885_009181 [Smutsia gigantea]
MNSNIADQSSIVLKMVLHDTNTGHVDSVAQEVTDRWESQGSPQTSLSAPAVPQSLPFPPALHRSSFPDSTEAFDPRKPDPYELYEKSRAIYESRQQVPPRTSFRMDSSGKYSSALIVLPLKHLPFCVTNHSSK